MLELNPCTSVLSSPLPISLIALKKRRPADNYQLRGTNLSRSIWAGEGAWNIYHRDRTGMDGGGGRREGTGSTQKKLLALIVRQNAIFCDHIKKKIRLFYFY